MKHVAKIAAILLAFLMIFAGCSTGSAGSSDASSTPSASTASSEAESEDSSASGEEVTLSFMHHMGEQGKKDALVALSEDFTAKNPNIKVEVEFLSYDDFINVFKQRAAADNAPDFVQLTPYQSPETIDAGLILELDSDLYPAEVGQDVIEPMKHGGKYYAIPLSRSGYGMYYNKNMLEKAGVDPSALSTISGLLDACQKVKDAGMVPLASGYAESWTENMIIEGPIFAGLMKEDPNMAVDLMSGDKKFSDYPELATIVDNCYKLLRDYALVNEEVASNQASDQYAQFGRGDAAMMMQGVWAITDIRTAQEAAGNTDEFGFTYYAWSDDESRNYLAANGDSIMCSAGTKHPEEAKEFLKYMMTKEAGKIWSEYTGTISAVSGVEVDNPDPIMPQMQKLFDEKAYYFEQNSAFTGQYYSDLDKIFIQGRVDGKTSDEVIAEWQEAFDNIRAIGG